MEEGERAGAEKCQTCLKDLSTLFDAFQRLCMFIDLHAREQALKHLKPLEEEVRKAIADGCLVEAHIIAKRGWTPRYPLERLRKEIEEENWELAGYTFHVMLGDFISATINRTVDYCVGEG
jgi:uncharacterized protein YfcZ (UPF0381/DUF406 family)